MATSILTGENSLGKGMKDSSSAVSDPRQPSSAKPYIPPPISPQDLPVDYAGFLAVALGVTGVMFRYKLCSWLAIIFCAESFVNMRNLESDLKQISMAMMFAIMGLVTNYLPKTSIHCSTLMLTPKTFSWEHYHLLSSFKIKP
ncbi:hypothetical protein HPP92_019473 [Vanilla planifolia]|uniref:Asterix n=1 Tax=Vanilla planifolia TaxID=51239 RepID=A0A835UHL2_VANPL|nr:hypothetical protein HPP92_019473 [Vanilla planifolia]